MTINQKRTRGPSPEKTEATRNDICENALTLFLEQGFEKTTMAAVAQRAQVAKGTLYLYFPSKESLFQEIFSSLIEPLRQNAIPKPKGIADFYQRFLLPMQSDPTGLKRMQLFSVIWREAKQFPTLAKSYHEGVIVPMSALAQAAIDAEIAKGQTHLSPMRDTPILLVAPMISAMIWNQIFPNDPQNPKELLNNFLSALIGEGSQSNLGSE